MENNNDFFYNGYDDNSQDNTKDPFSQKKTFYDPDSGVFITNEDPVVKVATTKDGRNHYISSFLVALIVLLAAGGMITIQNILRILPLFRIRRTGIRRLSDTYTAEGI